MELTIDMPEKLCEQIAWYRRAAHKQTAEEAVTELLWYALTLSPRQRLLDMLHHAPEGRAELSADEQLALADRLRQELFDKGIGA